MNLLSGFTFNLLIILTKFQIEAFSKCTKEYCTEYLENIGCPDIEDTCKNKNYTHTQIRYPDVCNCCEYCLVNLKEGDECQIGLPGLPPPAEICGATLTCKLNNDGLPVCQPMESQCMLAQSDYDTRHLQGQLGMKEVRPICNADGSYAPYHCIPGSTCYCISPTGERIFGENTFLNFENRNEMHCGCSLVAWKASNILRHEYGISVVRCTETGSYDSLQCTMGKSSYCFCIDTVTGTLVEDNFIVAESEMDTLPCFDSHRHSNKNYMSLCEKLHQDSINSLSSISIRYYCQIDGKFARIQIFQTKKVCVDPYGKKIEQFEALENTAEEKVIDCNCARTRWILREAKMEDLPQCCTNGNFKAWQCNQNLCYCVDNNGNQVGIELPENEKSNLPCFKKNNENSCVY